jgi:hypothetical protein
MSQKQTRERRKELVSTTVLVLHVGMTYSLEAVSLSFVYAALVSPFTYCNNWKHEDGVNLVT